jgi:hypothetical protein
VKQSRLASGERPGIRQGAKSLEREKSNTVKSSFYKLDFFYRSLPVAQNTFGPQALVC